MDSEWADELTRDLEGVVGRYDLARACLKFAVRVSPTQDVYGAFEDTAKRSIAALAGGLLTEIVPQSVVELLLTIVLESEKPGLAAWLVAREVSVACGSDFSGSMSVQPDEYVLEHLSPVIEPSGPLVSLYGSLQGLSSSAGDERDRANPARVPGLSLWVAGPETNAIEVTVDRRCGRRFDDCVSERGLTVALIQPNASLSELTIDSVPDRGDVTPEFFGVHATDRSAQAKKISEALQVADETCAASIAMMPELSTFEEDAVELGERAFDNLKIVISGSYHHVDGDGVQRNSILTHFVGEHHLTQKHSKTGVFKVKVTEHARNALGIDGIEHQWMDGQRIREQVVPSFGVRLFLGEQISCMVLICADFLEKSVKAAIEKLRPSVVLVSSMTPKVDVFVNHAAGLVGSSQSTTILVNNPGDFCGTGVVGVFPVAHRSEQTQEKSMEAAPAVALLNTLDKTLWLVGDAGEIHVTDSGGDSTGEDATTGIRST